MAKRGRLIAICGIDGSGKSVQADMLARRATEAGLRAEVICFPRYGEGFFGELVARYLRGEFAQDPSAVSPYLAALPFACDRWQAAPTLRAWLDEGAVVICNRYVPANLAHQGAKIADPVERRRFTQWVEELEYNVFGLPKPELHLWLDMPVEVAVELIGRKSPRGYLQRRADIHENSRQHLAATREAYGELARDGADWLTVSCARAGRPLPPEEIARKLWQAVSRVLQREP